jgi:hypothetical protein
MKKLFVCIYTLTLLIFHATAQQPCRNTIPLVLRDWNINDAKIPKQPVSVMGDCYIFAEFKFQQIDQSNACFTCTAKLAGGVFLLYFLLTQETQAIVVDWKMCLYENFLDSSCPSFFKAFRQGTFSSISPHIQQKTLIPWCLHRFVSEYLMQVNLYQMMDEECSGCHNKLCLNTATIIAFHVYLICGHILCGECCKRWDNIRRGLQRTCPLCATAIHIPYDIIFIPELHIGM